MGMNLIQVGYLLVCYIGIEALYYRYPDRRNVSGSLFILGFILFVTRTVLALALFLGIFVFLGGL